MLLQSMRDGIGLSVIKSQCMSVHVKWAYVYVKQGGTAGRISCPGSYCRDFFVFGNSKKIT